MLLVHYNFFPLSEAGVRRESVVATEQNQGRMLLKGVSRQQNKLIVPSIFPYNKTAVRILGNLTPLERSCLCFKAPSKCQLWKHFRGTEADLVGICNVAKLIHLE